MEDLDLVGYLTSKGLQTYTAAGPEVTVHCLFCPDGDPKGKGKLYLNTETWLWECKRCTASGNRRTLLEEFGDKDELSYLEGTDPAVRMRILHEATELAHEMLLANDGQLEYLLARGLSAETIVTARFGYVPKNVGISQMLPSQPSKRDLISAGLLTVGGSEFFNDSLTIPYFSHGHVIQIREKKANGKYRTTGGDHARLYNADAVQAATDIIITEGEYDARILAQELATASDPALRLTGVVGLPGAGSWPANFETYFDLARRVFIALDPDDTGRQYAVKLKALLGTKARLIELPRQLPKCDWTEYLKPKTASNPHGSHTWRDIKNLVIEADLAGKRMFGMSEARAKWSYRDAHQAGIKLGFPGLDSVIRPGLKPGQVMIPLSKTGTGKSVFLSNVIHNVRGRRVLYISLELTVAEIFEHLRRIHHFWHRHDTETQMDGAYANLRVVDQNRLSQSDLATLVHEFTEDVGEAPELLIIDYLGYYARGFRGASAYEKVTAATMEIKAIAKENDCAVIVPAQVNRGAKDGQPLDADDARDSGVIEETGDFVISLFRPDAAVLDNGEMPMPTGAFNMGLLKSRHGGKGRSFTLKFSNLSLVIVDSLDRKATNRVDQENAMYRAGTNYDDYRRVADRPEQLRLA